MRRLKRTVLRVAAASFGVTLAANAFAQATTTVTRVEAYDYDTTYGELIRKTVEPDDSALKLMTEYGRDPTYGVVLTRTETWADPITGARPPLVVERFGYDTRKRYVETHTNAKGHVETRTFDERTGNMLTRRDPNQVTEGQNYDGWGRKVEETRADGTSTKWFHRKCVNNCVNGAVSVTIEQDFSGTLQTTVPTETFSDTLGRKVHERTWGFDGVAVHAEDRVFDVKGRLFKSADARRVSEPQVWTTYEYDDLGRTTKMQRPNAANTGFETTLYSFNGLEQSTTNAENQTRTEVRNGLGKLKRVIDAAGKTTAYLYDPFGNLTRTTDPAGNQINVEYDRLGRKKRLIDPDLGTWVYTVDPLGQTRRQVDARAKQTDYTYDDLGRMTQRLQPDLNSNWTYDTATKGVGKLAEAYTLLASGAKDYRRLYTYDALSRLSTTTIALDWDYTEQVLYDSFGRAYRHEYKRNARGQASLPGPYTALVTGFNTYGYAWQLTSVGSNGNTKVVWTTLALDAQGRSTKARMGNGLNRERRFNPYTGRLEQIRVGPDDGAGGATMAQQGDVYTYDGIGNLKSRTQFVTTSGAQFAETFAYDSLNRLKTSTVGGQPLKNHDYDDVGNLINKAGAAYNYPPSGAGSVRPHTQDSISGSMAGLSNPGFTYDENGNLKEGLGRRYTWTSFNQAAEIDKLTGGIAVQRTAFIFGTEHERTRQQVMPVSAGVAGSPTQTIHYAGSVMKEVDSAKNTTTIRTYLPAGLGFIQETITGTAVAATAEATRVPRYMLNDRLGTPVAVMDDAQAVLQRFSADPWGKRRNADGTDDAANGLGSIVNQQDHTGYTGQEQLDQLGLVHLNGRIYDPISARMVSADPTVPDAGNLQAFNRYSYVFNNALKYTDPSGFNPSPTTPSSADSTLEPRGYDSGHLGKTQCSNTVSSNCGVISINEPNAGVAKAQSGDSKRNTASANDVATGAGEIIGQGLRVAKNFLDGGFGDRAAAAFGSGDYGWAAMYTLAGTAYGVANGLTLGEAGGISKLLTTSLTKLESVFASNAMSAGPGAAKGGSELTRVGRWMSETEFKQMSATGRVVEGAGGRTSVISPPNSLSFKPPPSSNIYSEFNVPSSVLRQGGKTDWKIIPGPNIQTRIFGPAPTQMPPATCIVCVIRN